MFDSFTRHVGAITIALVAVLFALGIIWQVTHGHDVDALLAGLAGTTIGSLLPSPAQTARVTVENDPSDPVPTADVPAKGKRDKGEAGDALLLVIVIVVVAVLLGWAFSPWWLLLLLLVLLALRA